MTSHEHHSRHAAGGPGISRLAASATLHCLTGCAIGEVLGLVIATAFGFGNALSIAVSIVLAFVFGYGLTSWPLLRSGMSVREVAPLAFASDTISIATMELFDSLTVILIPGALAAGLTDGLFWWSLAAALFVAFWTAFPVNRWLIGRGKGHAVVHAHHAHHAH